MILSFLCSGCLPFRGASVGIDQKRCLMAMFGDCKRLAFWVIVLSVQVASCSLEPGDWVQEYGDLGSGGGAVSVFQPSGDLGQGGRPGLAPVADPCDTNAQCSTGYCMTTKGIGSFIVGADIQGGYCSALFCDVDGDDGTCTPEMGGQCFSLYAFLGADMAEMGGICLQPSKDAQDSRSEDDNICIDTKGCIPASVATAATEKLKQ